MSEDCNDLQDFLDGNLDIEYFSDIENLRSHWHECGKCQASWPDATSQIDSIEKMYLSRIRENLEVLHRQFEYAGWQILHPPAAESLKSLNLAPEERQLLKWEDGDHGPLDPSDWQKQYTELLKLLGEKGGDDSCAATVFERKLGPL